MQYITNSIIMITNMTMLYILVLRSYFMSEVSSEKPKTFEEKIIEREKTLIEEIEEERSKGIEKIEKKAVKTAKVIVIFPARNEESTIKKCIEIAKQSKYKPEVIVSDGHSTDKTAEIAKKAGAKVTRPNVRLHPGKGAAMIAGLKAAFEDKPDVIVFLDADIMNLTPDWIDSLVDAILIEGYDMSRGWYLRAPSDASVTKLVAKPLLWTFFPEISHYEQPLSGEVAAKASAWEKLINGEEPPQGWGIDVWFLIEASMKGFNIKEVFLGTKSHRSYLTYATDVSKLAKMGEQVGVTIIQEAVRYHRIDNVWSIKT